MMGHENITTTEVYMHVDTQHLSKSLQAFHPGIRLRRLPPNGNLHREYSGFPLYRLALSICAAWQYRRPWNER